MNPTAPRARERLSRLPPEVLARLPRWLVRNPPATWTLARYVQTPPWADEAATRAVYREARRLRARGRDVVVDHVLPLQGDNVSGLHVADNLRIVERRVNARKSNRGTLHEQLSWLPEEPEPQQLTIGV